MLSVARRNLLHDKLKLVTALTGVVSCVVLALCSTGLCIACSRQASGIGACIIFTAVLGLVVGCLMVSQTV